MNKKTELQKEQSVAARFWSLVDKRGPDECWAWLGRRMKKDGRGIIGMGSKGVTAPRVAWLVTHGEWPAPGLFVCHRCDVPACCNPDHLFLGTVRDNARDAASKGRLYMQRHPEKSFLGTPKSGLLRAKGESNGQAKLKAGDIVEMRRLRSEEGLTYAAIGERFGVALNTAHRIVNGVSWTHVK